MQNSLPSRRSFLKTAATLAVAPLILPSRVWAQTTAPGKRLTLGCIGMGKQMGLHLCGYYYGANAKWDPAKKQFTRGGDAKWLTRERYTPGWVV